MSVGIEILSPALGLRTSVVTECEKALHSYMHVGVHSCLAWVSMWSKSMDTLLGFFCSLGWQPHCQALVVQAQDHRKQEQTRPASSIGKGFLGQKNLEVGIRWLCWQNSDSRTVTALVWTLFEAVLSIPTWANWGHCCPSLAELNNTCKTNCNTMNLLLL